MSPWKVSLTIYGGVLPREVMIYKSGAIEPQADCSTWMLHRLNRLKLVF
jgi:hypothetical protein